MSRSGAALLIAASACVGACRDPPPPAPPREAAPSALATAALPLPTSAPRTERAPADPLDGLREAPLLSLTPASPASAAGRSGVFDAVLAPGKPARVSLALTSAPKTHRRAVAFYLLARALGSDLVPACVERRIGAGELGALLAAQPAALELVRARAAVQNDGTIDAVVSVIPSGGTPRGREILIHGSVEELVWGHWSRSPEPVVGEDSALLRSYIEMLVLDYLSGNLLRRTIWVDTESHTLTLSDNATAFPLRADGGALDRILRELRAVARFPPALRDALARLDRATAAAVFTPGPFETWLLPPRALIELDERRTGLLTLVDARIAERGVAAAP